jgi:NAD(P)H-flavin reductase
MIVDRVNHLLPREAVVEERRDETKDTFSLRLAINDGGVFNFQAGQFNMIGFAGFGEAPFSFSMIDEENKILVQTIRNAGNVVDVLSKLQKGQKVYFRGPYGTGWPLEKLEGKNVIVVAGGIGLAPLRPVVHHLIKNRDRFGQVYLLYGARTHDDMLFKDQFGQWSNKINVLLSADQVDGAGELKVHEGLVTGLFGQMDIDLSKAVTFTCGPQIMMKFVAAGLIMDGQDPWDIYISMERRMKCGIAHCGHCQIGTKYVCKDGPVFCLPEIQKNPDTLL